MTASDAGAAAIGDLLEMERALRLLAEQTIRDLRAALQLAAYTFAGEAFEQEIRRNQAVLETWTADDWMAFLQKSAPVGRGWADPAVLAERLRQITAERDAALADARRLQEELALRVELAAFGPTTPGPAAHREPPARSAAPSTAGETPWPDIPPRAPARYAARFSNWPREGLALALVAAGLSLRLEAAERLGRKFGVKGTSGSVKRVFDRLVEAGVLAKETVRVGRVGAMFVRLTNLGREVCAACCLPVRETEYERLRRSRRGDQGQERAAAAAIFAYQARRRGHQVEVAPGGEGPQTADVRIVGNGDIVDVTVTPGRKSGWWKPLVDRQGFVALCALDAADQVAHVSQAKAQGIAGRATAVEALVRDEDEGRLWMEVWE